MSGDSLVGSTARNPDLDWSQIRETILMLALSVAQEAYVLQSGRVVLSGESSLLLNDERVREAYLGM